MSEPSAALPRPEAPHICCVIGRTRHKMILIEIQEAFKRGARLIELRLDFLAKAPDFKRLLVDKPCPMVATIRRPAEGGRWSGTEEERLTVLRQAIVGGFEWVDLETDIADKIRRFKDVKRIVSYHNFRQIPKDLEKIHEQMCKQDADVVKIAVMASDPADNLRVLKLLENPAKPTVAFCMGDLGMPSRFLGGKLGTPFTYAAFNKERGIAPGLPSFDEMTLVYQYEKIDDKTAVYGVIGDPVAHSLSPIVHNRALRKLAFNAVYLPFRVPRGELPAFLKSFEPLGVRGFSVTIPHKEAAAALATVKGPGVAEIGAANTLVRGSEGWKAFNTDMEAALASLQENSTADGQPMDLRDKSVLILGAGGVARAIAHSLKGKVAMLAISNRTQERAQKLAAETDSRVVEWAARHNVLCDVLINCTSIGMHPNVDDTPIHHSFLKPGLIAFDTIYTPETTLLVKEARSRGCQVITGVDMFVRQAAAQFKLFTGQDAPIDLMRNLVKRILSPVVVREEE